MLKKLATAFCTVILLSACSSSHERSMCCSNPHSDFEKKVGCQVFFALNSSELSTEAKNTLTHQAEWLKANNNPNIIVAGHCDERGTAEYNIALGERRANSIKKFLCNQGIDSKNIETISYGKERPAVMGHNEDAWRMNRRGVTSIK